MPSTYSPNLRLELIGAGEQSTTWGDTTNRNLADLLEESIVGVTVVDVTSGGKVLTALNAYKDEARSAALVFVGNPSEEVRIVVPEAYKLYEVYNKTQQKINLALNGEDEIECPEMTYSRVYITPEQGVSFSVSFSEEARKAVRSTSVEELMLEIDAAPIESPNFTGEPTAPTAPVGDKSERIANAEFVHKNGAPKGIIVSCTLPQDEIPQGWQVCDGKNGTPDLRGRFILGAGAGYTRGSTGGSADAVLVSHNHGGATGTQSHNHTHSGSTNTAGAHTHPGVLSSTTRYGDADNERIIGRSTSSSSAGAHTHAITLNAETTNHTHAITTEGESAKGKNMPPYYSMYYIMKV